MDTVLVSSGFVLDQTEAPCPFNRRKPTWTTSVDPCHAPRNVEGPRPARGRSGAPTPKRTSEADQSPLPVNGAVVLGTSWAHHDADPSIPALPRRTREGSPRDVVRRLSPR